VHAIPLKAAASTSWLHNAFQGCKLP
jgi:hypothetical protein